MRKSREEVISGMEQRTIGYWLTVVPLKDESGYLCYIKLTAPFKALIGAVIRDDNGDPVISATEDEALSSGRWFMLSKLIGEE